jgi:palmitoyl transferase
MKKLIISLLLLLFFHAAQAEESYPCSTWPSLTQRICKRLHQIWYEGDNELYLSGYAWHNRYRYERPRIKTFNEKAWGGGLGKGFIDEKGNWHGLLAFAFLDSHKNIEPVAGYGYQKILHFTNDLKVGLGLAVLITQRPDIFKGIPFAGALPWISLIYRKVSINATYIPGAANAGNVLYIIGKLNFNLF